MFIKVDKTYINYDKITHISEESLTSIRIYFSDSSVVVDFSLDEFIKRFELRHYEMDIFKRD